MRCAKPLNGLKTLAVTLKKPTNARRDDTDHGEEADDAEDEECLAKAEAILRAVGGVSS